MVIRRCCVPVQGEYEAQRRSNGLHWRVRVAIFDIWAHALIDECLDRWSDLLRVKLMRDWLWLTLTRSMSPSLAATQMFFPVPVALTILRNVSKMMRLNNAERVQV